MEANLITREIKKINFPIHPNTHEIPLYIINK